jgi:hypothetical protein
VGAVAVALAGVLIAVLVARDDGSGSSTSPTTAPTTTSPPATTSTTSAPAATTVPSASTTRPASPATTIPLPSIASGTPASYAQYLFATWQNGDRAAAANVASAAAVDQMFSQAFVSPSPWTFQSCGVAAGSTYCTWQGAPGHTIVIQVRNATGGQPVQVIGVQRT